MAEQGVMGALRMLHAGREVARQNQNILRLQRTGAYWLHTPAEYEQAWTAAGFEILESERQYRGYSDLVVARKPA